MSSFTTDGAFPYYLWTSPELVVDGATPLGRVTPAPPIQPSAVAEILIDSEVVWSSLTSASQQQLSFDVRNFIGEHTVTFRIRGT